jgi:BolA protein
MTAARVALIRERLAAAFTPGEIEVLDESHLHKGHVGARDGKGHFRVKIVSNRFTGLPPLQRHRLVYDAVADLMRSDIHALAVSAITEDEARLPR